MKHQVFLSYSGSRAKRFAGELGSMIKRVVDVEPWFAPDSIRSGDQWPIKLMGALAQSPIGIVCLTRENRFEPYVHFEAGAIVGRVTSAHSSKAASKDLIDGAESTQLGKLFLISLDELAPQELPGAFRFLQCKRVTRSSVLDVCYRINAVSKKIDRNRVKKDFEKEWGAFKEECDRIAAGHDDADVESALADVVQSVDAVSESEILAGNRYLRRLLVVAASEFSKRVAQIRNTPAVFRLPHVFYPAFLIDLMRKYSANVKAVAMVDNEEYFWSGGLGDMILECTPPSSSRVFIFHQREQMERYIPMLRRHAKRYNVAAMSMASMSDGHKDFVKDFSLIGDIELSLLATYDDDGVRKYIKFSAETARVDEHEKAFSRIWSEARCIGPEDPSSKMLDQVFLAGHVSNSFVRQEMSRYIPPKDYDEHEELHAYFIEMMEFMLRQIVGQRTERGASGRFRVLELGAGTGHFTRRLASVKDVDIVAVEIDAQCFELLHRKAKSLTHVLDANGSSIHLFNEDSCAYDPVGRFDVVCSTFADHHIKPHDKSRYFQNIKDNLKPGGIFLAGDEFLPEYELSDLEARRGALRLYHGHIIDIARKQGHEVLAGLEAKALDSGIREIGDFKLSCSSYESKVSEAGFSFNKVKIGPVDRDDLGGVYVYEMRARG